MHRYTWVQFDKDIEEIVRRLKRGRHVFKGVWGPARGGLPIAVCLSHALGIPLAKKPANTDILIVDDIADTGKTLGRFACKGYFIATIFYHQNSIFTPDIWVRKKTNKWIKFPWEKTGN